MYKKQFAVQAQNLLSKKDLKTLKTQIGDEFPGLEEKVLDELLPEGQVKVLKLDNRSVLYVAGDQAPAFFDVEGKGEVYPTLNTLWQHPYMMAELTIHAPVSKFVLNGADLMLPGVIVPANGIAGFGTVAKGQRRCIKIEGNPYPIAVGKMLVNQTQMEKLKGKGLEVLHVYKDALWTYAGKIVPNAGFSEKEDEVTPCGDAMAATPSGEAAAAPPSAPAPPASGQEEGRPRDSEGAPAAAGGEAPAPPAGGPAEAPKAAAAAGGGGGRSAEDWSQDDLLDFCFMQAFKVSLTDEKALPIEASELYEKHMKPARPEGTTLDVKKSTHKQIGKFLNALRKAKVIEVNEKKGVVFVTKVDVNHKLFSQLQEKFASDAADAANAASTAGPQEAASGGLTPPKISTVWKPTHYTEGLFKAAGKGKSDLYTWEECRKVLQEYCEKESLMDGDDTVKLSEELLTILFRAAGAQKKDLTFPEKVEFSELEDKLQERMAEHTTIDVAGVGPTTRKGPALKIEVSLSRKGAHNITRICNLEAYGLDVEKIGDELKKKLNCTVHIEDMPGKNTKDKMMQLQGHVDQDLADYLLSRYGIPKSFMSVK